MEPPRFDRVGGVPALRVALSGDGSLRAEGKSVVYWMTSARRVRWNFALQRAVGWAKELKRPLVVIETLTCGGRWDSERHHRFVLQGMVDNARQFARRPALYYPFVERKPGECRGLCAAVCRLACVVITDDDPIAPPARCGAEEPSPVRIEKIDSNGLLPLRSVGRAFSTAHSFRRFLQRALPDHLLDEPRDDPLARLDLPRLESLPRSIAGHWPAASDCVLSGESDLLKSLPIDHGVLPVAIKGGSAARLARWRTFLRKKLAGYSDQRNQPEADGTSGLSPYLHHGHVSVHEVFHDLAREEQWSPDRLVETGTGSRDGWWGMSESAEAFLDQLVSWRELGFNFCAYRSDYDEFESLPPWAKATLAKHAGDDRPHVYSIEEFASARTHDSLWNAAQRQLLTEGRIHNYLRMLWGKKILEWSASPQEALDVMIELNNRYALDGQDPNSYSGISWVLGRYDRPWGPERPIFGTVRYMSSQNAARKLRLAGYMRRYGVEPALISNAEDH